MNDSYRSRVARLCRRRGALRDRLRRGVVTTIHYHRQPKAAEYHVRHNFDRTIAVDNVESAKSCRNNLEDKKLKRIWCNYLLLDPRIIDNNPPKTNIVELFQSEFYEKFMKSIFFVGKGKWENIHSHLLEGQGQVMREENKIRSDSEKYQHISDIWSDNYGVICLKVFQNSLFEESSNYETAIVDFIGLSNLKNTEICQYSGVIARWPERYKLGSCLLRDAFSIYVFKHVRQLRPENIRRKI